MTEPTPAPEPQQPHRRRVRYSGKNPRGFDQKYKERDPQRYAETVAKVIAAGKTPAGTHRPIMVAEILEVLAPKPGNIAVDCTLGYGGHSQEILALIQPGGVLLGLDTDPIELPKTEARLRALGFGTNAFIAKRSNFAGIAQALAGLQIQGADIVLADLGVSSMQIDDPIRGFSVKLDGPLDMRMNPQRGQSASALVAKMTVTALAALLEENADEPHAHTIATALAGKTLNSTAELADVIRKTLCILKPEETALSIRRTFQALRIAVNDEFSALDALLRNLPACLKPGGCAAILTFHSGEDRRVKKSFDQGLREGIYVTVSNGVIRPTPAEQHSNPRSSPTKFRWARRAAN